MKIAKTERKKRVLQGTIYTLVTFSMVLNQCQGRFSSDGWMLRLAQGLPPLAKGSLGSWRFTDSCRCGHDSNKNDSERIVGGVLSRRNAWPWMGAVVFVGDDTPKLMCGASVISEDYLLTAGHCATLIKRRGVDQFQILLGTNDLNDTDAVVPKLEKIIVHPKYNSSSKAYDAALLKLAKPLQFSSNISPICLTPQKGSPYRNKEAIVAGWGSTKYGGQTVTMQMQTMVNVTSNRFCEESYAKSDEPIPIPPVMMCAIAPSSDACQGDSGGPLFIAQDGGSFTQVGIVSFGSGCASMYPGVYTRVGPILSWIKSVTSGTNYCRMRRK